ncbi:hypothetical protein RRG08_020325 [Elysia crispata]|uniref:Uncharacterized protein n=1 Tax=Elysia crispata TaxID=231223 RepID=A0AAE0YD44_9GAST|nr:hypothetical protein RRG08_020325 [Elysia crispata]
MRAGAKSVILIVTSGELTYSMNTSRILPSTLGFGLKMKPIKPGGMILTISLISTGCWGSRTAQESGGITEVAVCSRILQKRNFVM